MLKRLLIFFLKTVALTSALITCAGCVVLALTWIKRPPPRSAKGLLGKADDLAWNNDWPGAFPLYATAEALFDKQGDHAHALYAHVSRAPVVMESTSLPQLIAELNEDLQLPVARDPNIRLRILEVKARCEEEYNASLAARTLADLEKLALDRYKIYLASRASGERGILSFTLGNFEDAATRVKRAYAIAKYFGDPAAHVRFAGMIGVGLGQMGRAKQALVFLDEAIDTQNKDPDVARPYFAINAKIDCLSELGRNEEAMTLADHELTRLRGTRYHGQLQSLLTSRADVLVRSGDVEKAIAGYREALVYARQLSAWRAITNIDGKLALAYERAGDLSAALSAIDDAIQANSQAPQEMFLVPGNLALKAKILVEMGRRAEAENVYAKGADIIDLLLSGVPTPEVERLLLAQLSDVYSGYFGLVSDQGRFADAFDIIERARGRMEAQQIEFDHTSIPQPNDPEELRLYELELKLLSDTKKRNTRNAPLSQIRLPSSDSSQRMSAMETASLSSVQKQLGKNELLIEYVLTEPHSYALVIGKSQVLRYVLSGKKNITADVRDYRNTLLKRATDPKLGKKVFGELLGFTREYPTADSLIIVADGDLHLLPFSALIHDSGRYLVESKAMSMVPSGTVLCLLRTRRRQVAESRTYLGVAPWADYKDGDRWVVAKRSGDKSEKSLLPLPQSRDEVESIAAMVPTPSTVLVGSEATKDKFQSLPLSDYRILHLALHGIIDPIFPDRSSLVFAPSAKGDGRLAAREIRRLRLRANLVTLSACDTAVGPVSAAGVESLDTAFIEAGADAVVSTLWELQDSYTDLFMKSFYRHLGHESKSAALRDAKLDLLHAGIAPYDWAAYELVGNPSGSPLGMPDAIAHR